MKISKHLNLCATRDCYHGFTLVELLVVMAIISLLAAMLLPLLAQARNAAYETSCAQRQKQIGLSLLLYTDDFDGALPAPFGRNAPMFGAWSIPRISGTTTPWCEYMGMTTAWIANYLNGPPTMERSGNHVLRCPSNPQWLHISGDFNKYQSSYLYTAPHGFVIHFTDDIYRFQFYLPFRVSTLQRIVDKYGFPYLLLLDRIDYRRRWSDIIAYPNHDSNHGKRESLRGGNSLYLDGHVKWRPAIYFYTGTMAAPPDWQVCHNDAWDAFLVPTDCVALIKHGNRTRFFKGADQSSGVQWYNPLTDTTVASPP